MAGTEAVNRILAGAAHLLGDQDVELVLERMYTEAQLAAPEGERPGAQQADGRAEPGFSPRPAQGELMYLLCRSLGARTVLDFATSAGASAIYLAAALRDNGGGRVISADWRPERIAAAKANVESAGLGDFVEFRCGDPSTVLADLTGPLDFAWIDGWPHLRRPSHAFVVLRQIAPALRRGALILNDAREPDYVGYVRDHANGFRSTVTDIGVLSVHVGL